MFFMFDYAANRTSKLTTPLTRKNNNYNHQERTIIKLSQLCGITKQMHQPADCIHFKIDTMKNA